MTRDTLPKVAVVGAGFSGAMTALHLAGATDGPCVHLFDRPGPFARGAAFAGLHPEHLLNVRASNMSAWPDQPDHFADWLAEETGAGGQAFAHRADYGRYLQSQLASLAESPQAAGRLVLTPDAVIALHPQGDGWVLETAMGRRLVFDAVCLAIGNLPPHAPPGSSPALKTSAAYIADPWRWSDADINPDIASVLLIGTGLTMVDVALALTRDRPRLKVTAISRRGLAPLGHDGVPSPDAIVPPEGGPAAIAHALRHDGARRGWRNAVDAFRPHVQATWRGWSDQRRASFLRHARPYWDIHRHRLAPAVAAKLETLRSDSRLDIFAGRILVLEPRGDGIALRWIPRASSQITEDRFDLAINCTGPSGSLGDAPSPLLRTLSKEGRIRPDTLGLGLDCDDAGRLIDEAGRVWSNFYAVGPLTRGASWEITAVPDIRVQARDIAVSIAAGLVG